MKAAALSAADAALVSTIYSPSRARQPWMIHDVLPPGPTTYYSLARWALVDALRAFGVGGGDRVLIPALICRDVLAALNMVGAMPAFYSVSSQLDPTTFDDVPGLKAVMAVNYFGFPQDLTPFRRLCARTGAALIEDNAHGLFSKDEDGRWLGGRGDAGLFSFRKTIAVPDGGALVLGSGREAPAARGGVRRSTLRHRAKQAVRHLAGLVHPVRTLSAIDAVRRIRKVATGEALPSSAPDAETRIPLPADPPPAIAGRMMTADPTLEAQRRRALYHLAGRILESTPAVPVFPTLPAHVVPYGFPLLAGPDHLPAVSAQLSRHGLPLLQWPDLPAAVAASAPDHYRHLLVVPFLW